MIEGTCKVDGCIKPVGVKKHGWCYAHYVRWRKSGDPGSGFLLRQSLDPNATEKACTRCQKVMPMDAFWRDPRKADGRWSACRGCAQIGMESRRRARLYGLDDDDYLLMLAEAQGRCRMCGEKPDRLVVDHCHRTGAVRALLCDRCNRLLGVADDNVELLLAAINFLGGTMRRLEDDSPTDDTVTVDAVDSRDVTPATVGTPVRDAAVDPADGDFLVPLGAGEADPHGPDVVSPGLHASQDVRPVRGKRVREAAQQDRDESSHAAAVQRTSRRG